MTLDITQIRTVVGLPNLLIVGAQKSGTTSLATALAEHKRIYMPPEKELNFFSNPDWSEKIYPYLKKFRNRRDTDYWIDATPGYLWTQIRNGAADIDPGSERHDIPKAIKEMLGPNVRILVILRHPVKRAVSAFFHHFRMARIGTDERIRTIGNRQGILELGHYSEHLKNYWRYFSTDQIKVLFFEEYMKDPAMKQREVFEWLGLDPAEITPAAKNENEGFKLDYRADQISIRDGIEQLKTFSEHPYYKKMKLIEPPIVEPADIAFLNEIYSRELAVMATLFPATASLWHPDLTLENYRS